MMWWIHILIKAGIVLGFIGILMLFASLKSASDADDASNQAYRKDMRDMAMKMRKEHERFIAEQE